MYTVRATGIYNRYGPKLKDQITSSRQLPVPNFTEIHPVIWEINPFERKDEQKEIASNKYDERE